MDMEMTFVFEKQPDLDTFLETLAKELKIDKSMLKVISVTEHKDGRRSSSSRTGPSGDGGEDA